MESFAYLITGFLATLGLAVTIYAAFPGARKMMHALSTSDSEREANEVTEPTPLRSTGS